MKCLNCGNGDLYGLAVITKLASMADRGGSIKIGGLKVGQVDAKEGWDTKDNGWNWIARALGIDIPEMERDAKGDKLIRGPIFCVDCESEHYYVSKSPKPLRLGSYFQACSRGYAVVLEEK